MARFRTARWLPLLALAAFLGCAEGAGDATANVDAPGAVARGAVQFVAGHDAGLAHAQRTGKPVMLFFTAPWCTYCHQMADEAFTDAQIVALADRFTCVLVDADEEPQVCQYYGVRGFPTVQFLAASGQPLSRVVGKQPPHQLLLEMHSALQEVTRRAATPAARGWRG